MSLPLCCHLAVHLMGSEVLAVEASQDTPRFGGTLVTSQGRGEVGLAAALVRPRLGRQLFFRGSYLHGVLPGRPWLEATAPGRRLTLMVGWWTSPIATAPATEPPRPLMRGGGRWRMDLGRAAWRPTATAEEVDVACTSPVWTEVAGAAAPAADPPYGRYFLPRGQSIGHGRAAKETSRSDR